MKIATVSEDGVTISQHFGRAPFYVVVTVEDGQVVARERRDKLGHRQFASEAHHAHDHAHDHTHDQQAQSGATAAGHGTSPQAHDRHERMAAAISDCEVILSRGMGAGAYRSLAQIGVKPIVTDIASIDEAALAYAAGQIEDHTERLH
jgi:predicted Fe-Mo cluster-binding NifX family protein